MLVRVPEAFCVLGCPVSPGDHAANEVTNEAHRERVGMQHGESLSLASTTRIRLGA